MNRPALLASGAATLLAGALAFVLIRQSGGENNPAQATTAPSGPATDATMAGGGGPEAAAARKRQREEAENAALAAKYGESRTNLSKHITGNVIGLLEDAIQMGEMATSGSLAGALGGGRAGLRMGLGRVANELNLTEEQQQKAAALYSEFQQRELQRSKESLEKLRKDPAPLMRLMLASDAFARGEITEEELKTLRNSAGEDLQGIVNPLNERNFRGGRPLRDATFVAGLEAILDPAQAATLRQSAEQQQQPAANPAADEAAITGMPSMELEKLDTTIESVKKLTTGFKTVMEGFGGLQDLGPLIEEQRRRQQQDQPQAPAEGPPAESN